MKYKCFIYWLLVILWMCFIFYLSSMSSSDSLSKSSNYIESATSKVVEVTNSVNITNYSKSDVKKFTLTYHYFIRKCMHVSEYLILFLLLYLAFKESNIKKNIIIYSIIITFIYSCSDEIHQLFVGRTGLFRDVLIDMIGPVIVVGIILLRKKIR